MDPEYHLARVLKYFEEYFLGGEAVPVALHSMAGTTTGCGENLSFGEGGISIRPAMESMDAPLSWHPGPDDPWRKKVDIILNRLLDEAPGRFIVRPCGQFRHMDLLNMLRGNTEMMLDLAMNPDACKERLREIRELTVENNKHFQDLVKRRQGDVGYFSWPGLWRRESFTCAQADVAACISTSMFEEFVLPELDFMAEEYRTLEFHTCGYKQHLDLCLTHPHIKAIQYSPNNHELQNGPAHLEFYRQVQKSGRCLDIHVPPEHVEFIISHLSPEGLHVKTSVESEAEVEELLANAVKWSGKDISKT